MEVIKRGKIHYRLLEEIDNFLETGYCSYWKVEECKQFIKPLVEKNSDGDILFRIIDRGVYLLFDRMFGKDCQVNIFYDLKKYIYQHYENNNLIFEFTTDDYLDLDKFIKKEMDNYCNILLSY